MTIILTSGEKEYLQGLIADMPEGSQEREEAERLIETRDNYDELKFWTKREANYND